MGNKVPEIKMEFEVCKTCNGTGRNYWLATSKPTVRERLCSECYGIGKRPLQAIPDPSDPNVKAVAIQVPEGATEQTKDAVREALEKIGKTRELSPEETANIFKNMPVGDALKNNPLGPYADYEEMSVEDVATSGISGVGYADDATMPIEPTNAPDKAKPTTD